MQETLPFVVGSETSQDAAKSARKHARRVARLIYSAIVEAGDRGRTRDELDQHFKESGLTHQSITARARDLVYSGLCTDGPDRRKTAQNATACVLRAVPGADFDALYRVPPPGAGHVTRHKRLFLEAAERILGQAESGTITMPDAQQLLWNEAQRIREVG